MKLSRVALATGAAMIAAPVLAAEFHYWPTLETFEMHEDWRCSVEIDSQPYGVPLVIVSDYVGEMASHYFGEIETELDGDFGIQETNFERAVITCQRWHTTNSRSLEAQLPADALDWFVAAGDEFVTVGDEKD